jgi:predicted transcriptional regulator
MKVKAKRFTHNLPIALMDCDVKALEQIADKLETNRTAIARIAIKEYLRRNEQLTAA